MTKLLTVIITVALLFSCQSEEVVPLTEQSHMQDFQTRHGGKRGLNSTALQAVIEEAIAPYEETGIQATVIATGRGNWTGVAGFSYADVPIDKGMIWQAASPTRTFTAAAIMQLQEEGKLSLKDPISKWIEPLNHVNGAITVRDLLGNTSGTFSYSLHPDFIPDLVGNPGKIWTNEEILENYLLEPDFEIGEGWGFSNTDYLLLGMIIEEITGNNISQEFRKRFFEPLELFLTSYAHEESPQGEVVHQWADPFGTGTYIDFTATGFPLIEANSIWRTSGGLMTNPRDLAKWAMALYGGRVLHPQSLDQMLTFNLLSEGFHPEIKSQYGLGVHKYYFENGIGLGHRGAITHRCFMVYFPKRKVAVGIGVNRDFINVFDITDKILDVLDGDLPSM